MGAAEVTRMLMTNEDGSVLQEADPAAVAQVVPKVGPSDACDDQYQSSTLSPGTRLNSRTLCVTKMRACRRAMADRKSVV